jgi:hypothetical protein
MAGLAILKHMHNLSDDQLVLRWVENPYYALLRRGALPSRGAVRSLIDEPLAREDG